MGRDLFRWQIESFGALTILLPGGLCCIAYWLLLGRFTEVLDAPALSAWYDGLPEPVKPLVRSVSRTRPPFPSASWRHIRDVSQELNSAAVAMVLFSSGIAGPIWRRSGKCVLIYFAPVVIPLLALFLGPLFVEAIPGSLRIRGPDKLSLGIAAVVWAVWSMCFFLVIGWRDFVGLTPDLGTRHHLLADIVAHNNKEVRRVARDYFVGRGSAVFQVLVLAFVPMYFDYLGLFEVRAPASSASAAVDSRPSSDAETPDVGARLSSTMEHVACPRHDRHVDTIASGRQATCAVPPISAENAPKSELGASHAAPSAGVPSGRYPSAR